MDDAPHNPAGAGHIVILGAGFGGVYAARRLQGLLRGADARLTLVSRENYFLFTPLLHEVATGSLAPSTIIEPLRKVLGRRGTELRQEQVRRVRLADRVVETEAGEIPYDALLIALGAETNHYGVPGAEEHSIALKSVRDAIDLKRKCITAFEAAASVSDPATRRQLLRFVVVGGGATGVELAAELQEFVASSLEPAYRGALGGAMPSVVLLQQGPELLPPFTPAVRRKALEVLRRKGVDVRLGTAVAAVDAEGVTLGSGERVTASAVAWVAGVRPAQVAFDLAVERDRSGRIVTDAAFRVKGHAGVFAIGDVAAVPSKDGAPYPMFAQVAAAQARLAAENLRAAVLGREPEPFSHRHLGNLVSLGQWMAAAEIGPFRFWGHFAWWLWRTVYLTKFISVRKKFTIALQWTINLVSPRDISII